MAGSGGGRGVATGKPKVSGSMIVVTRGVTKALIAEVVSMSHLHGEAARGRGACRGAEHKAARGEPGAACMLGW